jgi:rubrerythrin
MHPDRLHAFLFRAIQLEAEATSRYEELADAMQTWGNVEVERFFRQMSEFARLHLKQAMHRGGFRHLPAPGTMPPAWPDGAAPECASWEGVDGCTDVAHALQQALEAEQRSHDFYQHLADSAVEVKVRWIAQEFAEEEAEHIAAVKRLIARHHSPHG